MLTSEKRKRKKARSDVNAGITHFDVKRKARLDMNAGITHIDVKRKARPDINAGITHAAVKRNTRSDISAGITVVRLRPVLSWANVCSPEHTSDTSTNYDSFLN